MKTIQMPKESQPLLKFAEASEQDTVVFTAGGAELPEKGGPGVSSAEHESRVLENHRGGTEESSGRTDDRIGSLRKKYREPRQKRARG